MFTYNLFDKSPWEMNISPDAKNEHAEVYIETHLSEYLVTDRNTKKKIESMKGMYVALVRFLEDDSKSWVVMDKKGVIQNSDSYEGIAFLCDALRFAHKSE